MEQMLLFVGKQLHIFGGGAKSALIRQSESQRIMTMGTRLDDLDGRLEGSVSKWSRRKLLTIRTVLLILVATLSAFGAMGLAHIHGVASAHRIEVALQLNGQSEMTESQLREVVTSNHLLVYWAGGEKDARYLLSSSNRAAIVLTILPPISFARSTRASYPEITTYVIKDAFQVVLSGGGNPDVKGVVFPSGNSVYYTNMDPKIVYVGIRGKDIELQIFDPTRRLWLTLLKDPGRLRPIA